MRLSGLALLFASAFFVLFSVSAQAQFRENVNRGDFSGPVIDPVQRNAPGDWSNLFNMQMSHSYSMTFSSVGGEYRNLNAYTNTMNFFFTDDLTGRVDISLLHSPFGNSYLNSGDNALGAEVIVRNAELNYQINDNSSITIQFQQQPFSHYRASPYDRYGFNRY